MSISIEPAKKQHAIELAVFALDLEPIGHDQLMALCEDVKVLNHVTEDLPSVRPIKHVSVQFGASEASIVNDDGGLEFHDSLPGTPSEWTLSINRSFITVVCFNYNRWDPVKNTVLRYLAPVFDLLCKRSLPVNSVTLQYVDSFEVLGAESKKSAVDAVLNLNDSGYLSPMLKSLPDFWHIHQGWFDKSASGSKLLNTLNVDFGASDGRNILKIHGIHKNMLINFDDGKKVSFGSEDLESIFDELHLLNKKTLNSILSEQSKVKIALNPIGD